MPKDQRSPCCHAAAMLVPVLTHSGTGTLYRVQNWHFAMHFLASDYPITLLAYQKPHYHSLEDVGYLQLPIPLSNFAICQSSEYYIWKVHLLFHFRLLACSSNLLKTSRQSFKRCVVVPIVIPTLRTSHLAKVQYTTLHLQATSPHYPPHFGANPRREGFRERRRFLLG